MANWTPEDIAAIGDYIIHHTTPDQRWRELADQSATWPCTGGTRISVGALKEWGKTHRWFQKRDKAFADLNPGHLADLQSAYWIVRDTILDQGREMGGAPLAQLTKMLIELQGNISRMLPREDDDGQPEFLSPDMAKDIANRTVDERDDIDWLENVHDMISEDTPS